MIFKAVSAVFLLGFLGADGLSLPPYITACKNGPDLNKCATEAAIKAYPKIVEGDKKYSAPSLNPLKLPQVDIQSQNLKLKFSDLVITGLKEAEIKAIEFNLEKRTGKGLLFMKNLNIISKYEIEGKILILPITGKGPSDISLIGGTYDYTFEWDLPVRDGKAYMAIKNPKLEYKLTGASFKLDNLFNGDPKLGPEMLKFLNENWEDVLKDIGKPIQDALQAVATQIVDGYCGKVPYEEIFAK